MMAETQTILGIGAGAVSKSVEGKQLSRVFNVKEPALYIKEV
jgi:coproporphyrinogen III oxidase-like Fe-S oxidoreductase